MYNHVTFSQLDEGGIILVLLAFQIVFGTLQVISVSCVGAQTHSQDNVSIFQGFCF